MSRLPVQLQPAWPILKRGHRALAVLAGVLFRPWSRLFGARGLPRTATVQSEETGRREPGSVTVHRAGPAEVFERGPAEAVVLVLGQLSTTAWARQTAARTARELVDEPSELASMSA